MKNKFGLLGELIAEMPIWQKIVSVVVMLAVVVAIAMGVRAISFNSELTEAEHKFDEFRVEETTTPGSTTDITADVQTGGDTNPTDVPADVDPNAADPNVADPNAADPNAQQPQQQEQNTTSNVVSSATKHNFSTLRGGKYETPHVEHFVIEHLRVIDSPAGEHHEAGDNYEQPEEHHSHAPAPHCKIFLFFHY